MDEEKIRHKLESLRRKVPRLSRASIERGFDIAVALLSQDVNIRLDGERDMVQRDRALAKYRQERFYVEGLKKRVMQIYDEAQGGMLNVQRQKEEETGGEKSDKNRDSTQGDVGSAAGNGKASGRDQQGVEH